jgi:peptidoglycan hydrolase CwlO-like protein
MEENELNETIVFLNQNVQRLEQSIDTLVAKLESTYSQNAELKEVLKKLTSSIEKLNESIWNKL